MTKRQWYEILFENYAVKYDNESFTQGTSGECDFIEKELNHNKSLKLRYRGTYIREFDNIGIWVL